MESNAGDGDSGGGAERKQRIQAERRQNLVRIGQRQTVGKNFQPKLITIKRVKLNIIQLINVINKL